MNLGPLPVLCPVRGILFALTLFATTLNAQPMFRIIEAIPPSPGLQVQWVATYGVSADGKVAVGCTYYSGGYTSQSLAFRWTAELGTESLGDLPGGDVNSCAYDVSSDGSVIVGVGTSYPESTEAVRWLDGKIESLGDLQGGLPISDASGVSADGRVIVGGGARGAFRWEDGIMVSLAIPGSDALAISPDGRVIVGFLRRASGEQEAFRWENQQVLGLGFLTDSVSSSWARGVSGTGSVIVGHSDNSPPRVEAFRWQDGVMTGLGLIPPMGTSIAHGVSVNGDIVVGRTNSKAFVWDKTHGMRLLEVVLRNDLGLNLGSWSLFDAQAISDDGLTIAGRALRTVGGDRFERGFVARLGAPTTDDDDGDGISNRLDVCPETILGSTVNSVGCPLIIPGDLDRDGDVDLLDFATQQRCFAGTNQPADPACATSP